MLKTACLTHLLIAAVIICNKTSPKWNSAWYWCEKDSFSWHLSVRLFCADYMSCSKPQCVELLWELSRGIDYLHHCNRSRCWSASHSQASGRLACLWLHQQINSNDQRATHWGLDFNSYSLNWPKHQSDNFMSVECGKDRIIKMKAEAFPLSCVQY